MSEFVPEGWAISPLGNVIKQIIDFRGRTPKKLSMEWGGGNIRALSANNVQMGKVNFQKECYLASEDLYQMWMTKGSTEKGDVLFTMEAPLGNVALVPNDDKYILSQRVILLKNDKNKVLSGFLYQQLRSEKFQNVLRENATGSTALGIQQKRLVTLDVVLPPLPEQQKIAAILTSVDEVIEKTQAQINKLKDLKTGMMQELLTRGVGVDGKPHTEFKDSPVGRIPKAWEVVKLSDTGKWKGGGTPSKSNKNYWSGSIPWVSPKDMKLDLISRTKDLITEDAIKGSSTNLITKNSLLMVVRSGILQHTLPVAIATCDLTINQDMKALSVSKGYCVNFIFYYLQAHNHTVLRATLKAGNTVESIDFNEFGKYLIPSPSLEEQMRISDVIASISNKIKVKEYKLSSLKNTKKALMQDLLTGKVRVKVDSE
ncbi:restriction endonuclease subunit S [Aliivibrio sp. S10_S31]|uniref:restriction endonuclease subunit S n=1 Tax=Aliivibrio sp. S10_S31 TaxID=2720224 RepID=UPI001680AD93|nr:restriction endonuclease subunit S [Aliivibrio sp. S10_S31]MBD1570214.1 hypothetical protein [Aliivibrio sp. S10_S31]